MHVKNPVLGALPWLFWRFGHANKNLPVTVGKGFVEKP